jgi:MoaD family protein
MDRECIQVQIKYFANFREITGKPEESIQFPIEARLSDVIDWLNKRYKLALPNSKTIGILNGKGWMQFPEQLATPLREGDAIGLMPIIHGG